MLTANIPPHSSNPVSNKHLSTSIEYQGEPVLSVCDKLVDYLRNFVSFDSLIILGYQNGCQPVFLFSSHERQNNTESPTPVHFDAHDPFYAEFTSRKGLGIYGIDDVVSDPVRVKEHRQSTISGDSYQDELAICMPQDNSRRIVVFLRRDKTNAVFSLEDKRLLIRHLDPLYSLCQHLWPEVWSTEPVIERNNLAELLQYSLSNFGGDILTDREKETTTLIVQGCDNKGISERLNISIATVKVHRKNIYTKFEVSSVEELFQVFLSYLVLRSQHMDIAS